MATEEMELNSVRNGAHHEEGACESASDEDILLPDPVQCDNVASATSSAPLSKNQQKKLLRKQKWEEGREDRKAKRREKIKTKRENKRIAKKEEAPNNNATESILANHNGDSIKPDIDGSKITIRRLPTPKQLPITFVFDCQFDDLMTKGELISLVSQLTRCYSDNRKSHLRAHLAISSYGGRLKERFEGVLDNHHKNWTNVRFLEDDWIKTAEKASTWMRGPRGGNISGALAKQAAAEISENSMHDDEVIYLSSESSETLTELKPYHTYIIGGLVDRNRHKGVCYERALEAKVRTAKLPIGEFMQMNSRAVLATNHVCEIMLKWLECGDWGKAFMQVIPKRKGGSLKDDNMANESLILEDCHDQEQISTEGGREEEEDVENGQKQGLISINGLKDAGFEEGTLKRKHEDSDIFQQNGFDVKRMKDEVAS